MKPSPWDYLREAFNAKPIGMFLPPNWAMLAGFGMAGWLHDPGWLVLGAGAELGYLLLLSTNARFQRFVSGKMGAVESILSALGARLDVRVLWNGPELDRLMDAGHAALGAQIKHRLERWGWIVRVEVSYSRYGERARQLAQTRAGHRVRDPCSVYCGPSHNALDRWRTQ